MNKNNTLAAKVLTYAGIIPFIALGTAVSLHIGGLDYSLALFAYGAVIIAFLCGIHWATFLFFSEKCARNLLLYSNIITLVGWLSVLSIKTYLTFALQILCFLSLLILDLELYRKKLIPLWFFHLRRNATIAVTLSLLLTACFTSIF